MADHIRIHDLRAVGRHGVLDFEKEKAQPFSIDLDLELDLRPAGASDALADTVDYGQVAEAVAQLVATETHELLERLADRIAEEILKYSRVERVEVTVAKLRPPIPVDLATVSVKVTRP